MINSITYRRHKRQNFITLYLHTNNKMLYLHHRKPCTFFVHWTQNHWLATMLSLMIYADYGSSNLCRFFFYNTKPAANAGYVFSVVPLPSYPTYTCPESSNNILLFKYIYSTYINIPDTCINIEIFLPPPSHSYVNIN